MAEKTAKERLAELWRNLRDSMCFTKKAGCPYCSHLPLDENGRPIVTHPTARKDET